MRMEWILVHYAELHVLMRYLIVLEGSGFWMREACVIMIT